MTKQVATIEPASNPLATLLSDPERLRDFPVETVERLWAMDKELRADKARIEYSRAMVAIQSEIPIIPRDASNEQTRSKYAKYEAIAVIIDPLKARHGFTISYSTGPAPEGMVHIIGHVMHIGGHTTIHEVDMEIDNVGIKGNVNKTTIHGRGSSMSYGRRYLESLIFDLKFEGDDDDGQAAGVAEGIRLIDHNNTLRFWLDSVVAIKQGLAEGGDRSAAAEAYAEIPRPALLALNVAPTKGGIWTTEERTTINRDPEFQAMVHAIRKDAGWYDNPENNT